MPSPDFGSADYELRWPRALFTRELAALRPTTRSARAGSATKKTDERLEHLLEEAFLGQTPAQDYRHAVTGEADFDGSWTSPAADPWADPDPADAYLDRLVARLPRLREHHEPRPYWPDRHGRGRDVTTARSGLRLSFAALVAELHQRGYFGRDLPPECVDDRDPVDESAILQTRLGIAQLWPLDPETWDEDTFLGLVEVFHDLAVRPRERWFHSYSGCGWHYSVFHTDTGRALYRWRINRLLTQAGLDLRLADDGEDQGRLVRRVDDARSELVTQVLQTPDPDVRDRVDHAVARFRSRTASVHDKRSAIITLAGILEERRALIRAEVGRKDEGALFQLANEFALRHQNRSQQSDYDPAFLDWIFWWYLGTVELTNRLIAREPTAATSTAPTSTAVPPAVRSPL